MRKPPTLSHWTTYPFGVPASNLRRIIPIGVLKVNFLDHLSTPMNGSILSRSSYLPYSIPTPVGAIILWPETAMKFLQHIRVFVKWSL
jgi:hypothetical protein